MSRPTFWSTTRNGTGDGVPYLLPLILRRLSSEGKALSDHLEDLGNAVSEIAGEDRRLGGCVILVFARFRTDIDDFSLLDNQHALSVRNGNDRSAGDDVVYAVVATAECGTLPSFGRQNGIW